MTEPLSVDGPWNLLIDLRRLVADRSPADVEIPASFAARSEALKKHYQEAWEQVTAGYENKKAATEAEYASARAAIAAQFQSEHRAAQREYEQARDEVLRRFESAEKDHRQKLQDARWEATTVYEATKDGPELRLKEIEDHLAAQWQELQAIQQDAVEMLRRRWQWRDYPEGQVANSSAERDPMHCFAELVSQAKDQWRRLFYQPIPRLFEGARPLGMFVLVWLVAGFLWSAATYLSGLAMVRGNWYWITVSGAGALITALVLWIAFGIWFYRVAKRQSTQVYTGLRDTLAQAALARQIALKAAKAECERQRAAIVERLRQGLKKADQQFSSALAELDRRKQAELRKIDERHPALLSEIAARRDCRLRDAKQGYSQRLSQVNEHYQSESGRLLDDYSGKMAETQQCFKQQWGAMVDRWRTGMERFQAALHEMNHTCGCVFPDWNVPDWNKWTPPAEIPPAIPFGRFDVDLGQIDGGLPADEQLRPAQTSFSLPALLPFRDRSLMLLKVAGEGRRPAVEAIQAVMLRMLTSMPPGKVRFTIVDPVGLGENFSAFMHLADYDEQLVSSRIWTETTHIEQRLADLTEHMENVIQLYLRNEFQSIQEYNEFAGEMAEPYRILVVANFPVNFSEAAGRRLASIVASGARCGVYTLLSVDTKLELPPQFHLADLEPHAVNLCWHDGWFAWEHADFGKLPLALGSPPAAEQFTDIVRSVGSRLKEVGRIEVPFEAIVPEQQRWWTSDSRASIDVPLGRAGAMKLQHLRLGQGTAQHVLIAGRTGSGKSTLLHALITSVALRYSPEEVELYLVDFKKGVEFKAFASLGLPHARVIAIESEREFGLSVLERLDAELKARGDLFRKLRVQDIQGFRSRQPHEKLPRALLIIDEFQELFVEDDKIAQSAALLLDRLVRQGRAFGIHVLLGSQTLAGAYSLPRSTMGQMAVRIALQCSEADAHLILSEENTAARLLARPGEAIYNDANGLYEGNHPFQVVWLPDHKREAYLQRIRQLAPQRNCKTEPAVVFEGNAPADPSENPLLHEMLAARWWPETSRAARAWLGSAVAIKDPTVAVFVRQTGNNLLLIGHREEAALGVLATCLISLAAQGAPSDPNADRPGTSFYILDGTRPDAPEVGFWNRLARVVPHAVKTVGPRKAQSAIAEIAEQLARRQQAEQEDAPPIYLIVYNLSRFRDLRRAEDEFSFSRLGEDEPPSPARQFSQILREGPALGVHALLWCDTYNNLSRWLERQSLRDLEMRVLFQMNASDSSNLIDSPAASRLGVHRAVLYNEEQGWLEKFRPYGLPPDDWLAWIKRQLHQRLASSPPQSPDQP